MGERSLDRFRDWLFALLMDYLVNSGWIILIKDFKKSEKRNERNILGLTDYQNEIIYLDKDGGTPRILIHEICHFALGIVLDQMAQKLPGKDLKKLKGKLRANKQFRWEELRTREFTRLYYWSLSKKQIRILQDFINEAQKRYKENEG